MAADGLEVDVDGLGRLQDAAPPRVAVVLGSGFEGLASHVERALVVPYEAIPAIPRPSAHVIGHPGKAILGSLGGAQTLLFQGRVHQYQGVNAREAAFPARIAAALGCETLVVTNASGGINPNVAPGAIVLICDHVNLTGTSPLTGWPGPPGGVPFVPMHDAYDPGLRAIAHEIAREQGMALADGVYAGLLGPAFETPAEVRYLRAIGADIVGMSTVPEVIAARALGMRVLGLSLVTNVAASIDLTHQEVLEAGKAAAERLTHLLLAILQRL